MQIECPSCGAAYEVPDLILARKRTMRCARCARDWSPAPVLVREMAAPQPLPTAPRLDDPAPILPTRERPLIAAPRASAGRKVAVLGAWAASLAALGLAAWWGVVSQGRVVHAWPASSRLYAAVGLR